MNEKAKPLRSLMRPIRAFFASIFEYTDVSLTPLTVANKDPIDSTDAKLKKKKIKYIIKVKMLAYIEFTGQRNHKTIKFVFVFQ